MMLTEQEKTELRALNEFMELLGVSEMPDDQWDRWKELSAKLNQPDDFDTSARQWSRDFYKAQARKKRS